LASADGRPRWLALLDRMSVGVCSIVWGAAILRSAPAFLDLDLALGFALSVGVIAGYFMADLLSGTVHWLADRYFDPRTPFLGPALIAPFREHHADPMAMTRHDFFEISGNNSLTTIPLALGLLLLPVPSSLVAKGFTTCVVSLAFSIIATNQFHCWAHVASPPAIVDRLQRFGLILSPEQHAVHHEGSHDRSYCVTNGWMNPLLDRQRAFTRLERGIERLTGKPRRET
jgi:Lipid desaturase domain